MSLNPSPSLDPERWARIAVLFERLVDEAPEDREALLEGLAAGDAEVRDMVRRMLQRDPTGDFLLDLGLQEAAELALGEEDAAAAEFADLSGRLVGPYRLTRLVGRGGMGAVYLAERDDGQFRMRAALKLLPLGMASDDARRRFLAERQVLAGLSHPNISRLLDGGIAEDGTPYFVMEYVEGRAIDRHCDEERLGLRERIELFRSVCHAVQYAHQNLVVHRDLKPSNIVVGHDGSVKLLDFGIAKLLSEDHEPALLTRSGVRVMTPRFAAPEQIRGEPVTTATDVYSLGVLLFELLTGTSPYRRPDSDRRSVEQAVLEEEPSRPSLALGRTGAQAALARRSTPEALRRTLGGDLDNIVLKAMEKEPVRRFQSARQLEEDLQRYLAGEPVLARPSTVGYRLRKYVRRHRAGVAGATGLVALLAGFAGFYTVRITQERNLARAEAVKAQATTRFLQQLLGEAYPSVARGETFSMRDLLARAEARVDSLEDQPLIQAAVLRTLGDVYREQGRLDDALPLLERAVAIHRITEPLSRAAGDAFSALGHLQYERKDYQAALEAHRQERAVYDQLVAPDDSLVLFATNNLAAAAAGLNDFDEALALHQEVLSRRKRLFRDTSELVHVTHNNLGNLYDLMGRTAEAEREFQTALAIRRAALPPDHPSLALSLNNLGTVLVKLGRLNEAEVLHREALDTWQRVYGPDHHRVGLSAFNLARVLERRGRLVEAESLYSVTTAIDRKAYGEEHLEVGVDLRRLGLVQKQMGNCAAAAPTFREADRIYVLNELPVNERRRTEVRGALGECLVSLDRYAEAEPLLLSAYESLRAADSAGASAATVEALRRLVGLYRGWGRAAQAELFAARLPAAR